jgi:hypothetical protein
MKIDSYSSLGWRYSSVFALSLCLLGAFANTVPVLAQDDKTRQFIDGESLGGIKLGMSEKKLEDLLGQPKEKGELIFQEGPGEFRQKWTYPDRSLEVTLSAGKSQTGAKEVISFNAWSGCLLTTAKGMRIGSQEVDVRQAYGSFQDTENTSTFRRNLFVVGSVHRGILFTFKEGKVRAISFGAAGE